MILKCLKKLWPLVILLSGKILLMMRWIILCQTIFENLSIYLLLLNLLVVNANFLENIIDGTLQTFKTRLIAKRFRQKEGIDYFDTYATIAKITSIRIIFALELIFYLYVH